MENSLDFTVVEHQLIKTEKFVGGCFENLLATRPQASPMSVSYQGRTSPPVIRPQSGLPVVV